MRFKPQRASGDGWINSGVSPPCGFVAASMNLAMVSSTQGDGELIAHLTAECTDLRNSEVVGIRWLSPANQARVVGDSLGVIPVANLPRLGQGQLAFIDPLWACKTGSSLVEATAPPRPTPAAPAEAR
jgi:hypothetical protein